jgi:hypothetical protein
MIEIVLLKVAIVPIDPLRFTYRYAISLGSCVPGWTVQPPIKPLWKETYVLPFRLPRPRDFFPGLHHAEYLPVIR